MAFEVVCGVAVAFAFVVEFALVVAFAFVIVAFEAVARVVGVHEVEHIGGQALHIEEFESSEDRLAPVVVVAAIIVVVGAWSWLEKKFLCGSDQLAQTPLQSHAMDASLRPRIHTHTTVKLVALHIA